MKKNNPVLFLLKLPPPFTGATLMNFHAFQNSLLHDQLNVKLLEIHYNEYYKDTGKNYPLKFAVFVKYCYRLIRMLLLSRPSFVYFQISPLGLAFYRDLIFVIIIRLFHTKILYHLHGKGIKDVAKNSTIKSALYKFVFNDNYVICLSNMVSDDINEVYPVKPYIVNNGIPVFIKELENKAYNPIPVLLFISNIRKQKGIYDYLEICEELKKKNIPFYGNIVGNERDMTANELNQLIKEKGLEAHLRYLGPKYNEEKYKLLLESDILIHPAYNEAWGLVLLEAMESGLPVVTTFEGSIPYIVDDNTTGFICAKGDIECMTNKTIALINDIELREQMGRAGREKFLKYFTIDHFNRNMLNTLLDVYQKTSKI